jgi:hypothetical protein
MSKDAIENISQLYIERLTEKAKSAQRDATSAGEDLKTATDSADAATAWKNLIDPYWKNVKNTNKIYLDTEILLSQLQRLAKVITGNVSIVADAVETLLCVVRETALSTDKLHNKMSDLKRRLQTADPNNGYLKKILEFDAKVSEAQKANVLAIRAVLDLLKEAYLLHFSLIDNIHIEKIKTEMDEHWHIIDIGNNEWMEFCHKIDILNYLVVHDLSLVQSVAKIGVLLKNDHAYRLTADEAKHLPLTLPVNDAIPTFPLTKEVYYTSTEKEFKSAQAALKKANENKQSAIENNSAKKTKLDAINAALTAANNAREKTKV